MVRMRTCDCKIFGTGLKSLPGYWLEQRRTGAKRAKPQPKKKHLPRRQPPHRANSGLVGDPGRGDAEKPEATANQPQQKLCIPRSFTSVAEAGQSDQLYAGLKTCSTPRWDTVNA